MRISRPTVKFIMFVSMGEKSRSPVVRVRHSIKSFSSAIIRPRSSARLHHDFTLQTRTSFEMATRGPYDSHPTNRPATAGRISEKSRRNKRISYDKCLSCCLNVLCPFDKFSLISISANGNICFKLIVRTPNVKRCPVF